jgi:hypothetical protein
MRNGNQVSYSYLKSYRLKGDEQGTREPGANGHIPFLNLLGDEASVDRDK